MAYEPTVWKNREVERPRTFELQNNTDGTVTLIPAEGEVIEAGTPIIADTMNKIENQLVELDALFTSVSNGKTLVANAITDKGVPTAADAEFATMASNIGLIQTGGGGLVRGSEVGVNLTTTTYSSQELKGTLNLGMQEAELVFCLVTFRLCYNISGTIYYSDGYTFCVNNLVPSVSPGGYSTTSFSLLPYTWEYPSGTPVQRYSRIDGDNVELNFNVMMKISGADFYTGSLISSAQLTPFYIQ